MSHTVESSNLNDIETKRNEASILAFFNIEAKRTWLIQKILKIEAKRTLLIQELTKIEAKRPLLFLSHSSPSPLANIARDKSKLGRVRSPHPPWAKSPDMPPWKEAGCRLANCRRRRVRRPGWPVRAAGAAGSRRPESWPSGGRYQRRRPAAPSDRSWHAGGNPRRHSYSAAPGGQRGESTLFSSCTCPGRVKKIQLSFVMV